MSVSVIVAMDQNGVIGNEGGLPWPKKMKADMQRFRAITMGHQMLMGRKTFDSIGKVLDGRVSIVASRDVDHTRAIPDKLLFTEMPAVVIQGAAASEDRELVVIGGADLYRLAMPYVDKVYLTVIHDEFPGNVVFPRGPRVWRIEEEIGGTVDDDNPYPHTFYVLRPAHTDGPVVSSEKLFVL